MTPLLRDAAIYAGLAVIGLSAVSEAQIPARPEPVPAREPVVGAELRRVVPAAAAPIVQQSPNGLYGLSITDAGIELRGPSGGVKITSAGIEIGTPTGSRITVSATGLDLWGEGPLTVRARETVEMVNGPGFNVLNLSTTGVELRSGGTVQLGVKGPGTNGVKITNTGTEIGGPNSLLTFNATDMRVKGSGTVELQGGGGPNFLRIMPSRVELTAASGSVNLTPAGVLVKGTTIGLNAGSGCPGEPVVRINDPVSGTAPYGGGAVIGHRIVGGSPTVRAC